MQDPLDFAVTRRDALRAMAVSVAALGLSEAAWAQALAVRNQAATTTLSGLRFFTVEQHRTVDRLTDLIIPTDDHSPGASAAKVADFIDYLLSGAGDETKAIWGNGLRALDRATSARWQRPFVECAPEHQLAVMTEMAARERAPRRPLERLFVELKERTIQGYYTSEIGIHQELRYKGNTILTEFVGCTHPEHMG